MIHVPVYTRSGRLLAIVRIQASGIAAVREYQCECALGVRVNHVGNDLRADMP